MRRQAMKLIIPALILSWFFVVTPYASETVEEPVVAKEETITLDIPVDNDELFAGYVDQLFNPRFKAPKPLKEEHDQIVYKYLESGVREIADGKAGSSIITVPLSAFDLSTSDEYHASDLGLTTIMDGDGFSQAAKDAMHSKLAFDKETVFNRLLAVCPYELYWYDKTISGSIIYPGFTGWYSDTDAVIRFADEAAIVFYLHVSEEYKGSGEYIVDTSKTGAASRALVNAQAVINDNEGKTDLKKLEAYRDYIRTQVTYNSAAAGNASTPYGNPWQMIWVFDENSETNVVCEGYSKAFQYLCDKSHFNNIVDCDIVTGTMGGGNHMWNLVTIDGGRFLADITNTWKGNDEIWRLFLDGATIGSQVSGYTVAEISYVYDAKTKATYADTELVISPTSYYDLRKINVAEVSAKIGEIGTVEYTDECKAKIDEAREAYDALAENQQQDVGNYSVLTAAEASYEELAEAATTAGYRLASADDNGSVTYSSNTAQSCISVTRSTTEWTDGNWYVINGNKTVSNRIIVNGTVNLILRDGAVLNVENGITVAGNNVLNIYGQAGGTGKLIVNTTGKDAAIGGDETIVSGGTIVVHGGVIEASSGNNGSAAIGGAYGGIGCNLTILGGSVSAASNGSGAGIGGGQSAAGGEVKIYNGSVNATSYAGAGIGGGKNGNSGALTIYGGTVTGSSTNGNGLGGNYPNGTGSITIHGGTVTANSDSTHAILSDASFVMTGGKLSATGGGHGIAASQSMTLSGGDITCEGNDNGIYCNSRKPEIAAGIIKLIAIGDKQAIYATTGMSNEMAGTGWMDTAGSTGRARIAINATPDDIRYYKKIQFPAIAVPVTSITLNKEKATLTVGGTETLTAAIDPADADQTVTWTSSITETATVEDGVITAIKAGTATITATATNGTADTSDDKTASCVVTVIKAKLADFAVSIDDWTYGSTASTPIVTGNTGNGAVTFEYKAKDADDSTYTTDVPASAGSFTIRATVAESEQYASAAATKDFTIAKAAGTIRFENTEVSKTYGDAAFTIVLSNSGDGAVTYTSNNAEVAEVDAESGEVSITGVGQCIITASVANGTNYTYETKAAAFSLSVSAADMSVTTEGYTGTYDGHIHGITVTAPQGATIKYGMEEGKYTFDTSPSFTDAGTYTVYYQVTKQNYATVTGFATVTISAADPVTPAGLEATYGQTLVDISLPTGWAWVDNTISVGNVGTNAFKADYTTSSVNYNSRSGVDVNVKVSAAVENIVAVNIEGWTYGGTAKTPTSTATFGADTVVYTYSDAENGTFIGTIPETAGIWYVKASVSGTDNYPNGEAVTSFAIAKADIIVSAPAAEEGLVYTGEPLNLITKGTTSFGEMEYSLDGKTYSTYIPKGTEAGNYTIYYRVPGDGNHNDYAAKTVNATISAVNVDNVVVELGEDSPGQVPAITVKVGEKVLSKDVDYTVGYRDGTTVVTKQAIEDEMRDSAADKEFSIVITLVGNYSGEATKTLIVKSPNKARADAVIDKINAIAPVEYNNECLERITAARQAYDALTEYQRTLVSNALTLNQAEACYAELKTAAENLAAADAVKTLISQIGTVEYNDTCLSRITAARQAYDALTDHQRTLVSNASTLNQAEAYYAELKRAAEDRAAADAVNTLISQIGTVGYNDTCLSKITAARQAYEALTESQKTLVTNEDVLSAAETTYAELKGPADQAAADAVIMKINAIGTVGYNGDSQTKITEARQAYNTLSDDQKALVTNLGDLTAAETRYNELKTEAEKAAAERAAAEREAAERDAAERAAAEKAAEQAAQVLPVVEEPITIPKPPASVKVTNKKNKVTITWKKRKVTKKTKKQLSKIKAVQVQYSTDPNFQENVITKKFGKNKTKFAVRLQKKTTYFIRVRYVGIDGVSRWSGTKSVRTK